jgi:hypothetical protein
MLKANKKVKHFSPYIIGFLRCPLNRLKFTTKFLGGNCVLAQSQSTPESKILERFNEIDTNKDGKIILDAYMAYVENPSEDKFKAIDADGDGYISQDEFEKAIKKRHIKRKRKKGSSS